ncbi:hypothetical protein H6G25_13260 [Dolichospermum sp. FACHB-1091]|nr:hypothetical protein [Dolichospermum sp. FACHB-1091]
MIDFANQLSIPVKEVPLPLGELMVADEVFVSGTYHEICPVSAVGGQVLGSQFPRPVTQMRQERSVETYSHQQGISTIEVCLPTHDFPSFSNTHHFYQKSGFLDFGLQMLKRI